MSSFTFLIKNEEDIKVEESKMSKKLKSVPRCEICELNEINEVDCTKIDGKIDIISALENKLVHSYSEAGYENESLMLQLMIDGKYDLLQELCGIMSKQVDLKKSNEKLLNEIKCIEERARFF